MDDAYCGGGDSSEGITSTAIPISAAALKMIKAAIFMGDPRHIAGLSYNVGTCSASGVSLESCQSAHSLSSRCFQLKVLIIFSLLPVHLASHARTPLTSNPTAIQPTPTAVMATMPTPTMDTDQNTDRPH